MAFILTARGYRPQIGADCFIAPNATLTGEVELGERCSVWFNAVIRGDVNSIRIGAETNIQDGAIIHGTWQKHSTIIGSRVSIGHGAKVHGCTIEDDVLIGMGAIVLDGATVGQGCIVAAGAVVLENSVLESGWLYAGIPARKIKAVSEHQTEKLIQTALNYPMYGGLYDKDELAAY